MFDVYAIINPGEYELWASDFPTKEAAEAWIADDMAEHGLTRDCYLIK